MRPEPSHHHSLFFSSPNDVFFFFFRKYFHSYLISSISLYFQKRLSEALKANVEVTGFTAPERCEEHPCNSDPCKNDGICSRQGSKYTCLCKPGWFGDHCDQDINECTGGTYFFYVF